MRRLVLGLGAALLAGCAKPEAPPAEPPAAPPALNLADFAGTWTVQSKAEGSDTVLVTTTLTATATTEGWTVTLPGRDPIPMTITVSGDSVMSAAGPYESALRKGVQVSTTGVMRLVGGKLIGTTVARYSVTTADSVLRLRTEATKNP